MKMQTISNEIRYLIILGSMRGFVVSLLLLVLSSYAHAQKANIGAMLGVNFTKVSKSDLYGKVGSKPGLIVGVPIEFYLKQNKFSLKPTIFFGQKGFDDSEGNSELKTNLWYVQMDLLFAHKIRIAEEFHVVISYGPYGAIAIGGKLKRKSLGEEEDAYFGKSIDDGSFKRYEAGVKIKAGFEYIMPNDRPALLLFGYGVGFMNINNCTVTKNDNLRNKGFEMSLVYFLFPSN